MAESLKNDGKGKGKDKPKGGSKKKDGPSMGSNITEIRKLAAPLITDILKDFKDMETDAGAWRAQIKDKYEKGANTLGCSRKLLRMLVAEIRAAQKAEAAAKEMEKDEADDLDKLRAALEGTPLGAWVARA